MIVCAGEALIDMLPRRSEAGEAAFAPFAGGSVFNTAIALGRLGAPTGFVSGLSNDLFGKMLTGALDDADVDTSQAIRSDRPTTLAFVRLTDGHASYTFYDENTAGRMIEPLDMPDLPETVEAAFFGGISLATEPCGAAYEALMAKLAPTRAIMIDPNVRPTVIADEEAYRARITRMMGMADIIKLSDEDLVWLLGNAPPADHATQLLEDGASLVCITEGSEGVTGYCSHGAIKIGAQKVDVVDTVGAGDTFNAGLLAALYASGFLTRDLIASIDHAAVAAALRYGAAAAAVTVSRPGADPPYADEI